MPHGRWPAPPPDYIPPVRIPLKTTKTDRKTTQIERNARFLMVLTPFLPIAHYFEAPRRNRVFFGGVWDPAPHELFGVGPWDPWDPP